MKSENQNKYKLLRKFAIIFFIILSVEFFNILYIYLSNINQNISGSKEFLLNLNVGIMYLCFTVLIIKSNWWGVLVFISIFEGSLTMLGTDKNLGLFLYAFGLLVALFFGLFRKNLKRRLFLLLLPILFVLIYLFFIETLANLLRILVIGFFEIAMMIFLFLLFRQYIEDLLPVKIKFSIIDGMVENTDNKINLTELGFLDEEIFIINEILHDKRYKEIAQKLHCSESSIKKKVHIIFRKFNCHGRTEFLERAKNYEFIFPDAC